MPDEETIFLGDLVDRGPDSDRVIELVRKNGHRCVLGNHEHMMIDHCRKGRFYGHSVWIGNGGGHTLNSYPNREVPGDVLLWLEGLPKYIEVQGCLLSHAFLRNMQEDQALEYGCDFGVREQDKCETTIIWNRNEPVLQPRWRLQICGHNSQFGLKCWYDDNGDPYALCLDDSNKRVLTGYHLESDTIYQQPYI